MEQYVDQRLMQRLYDSHPNSRQVVGTGFDLNIVLTHTESSRLSAHEHLGESLRETSRNPVKSSQVPVSTVEYFDGVRSRNEE